MDTKIYTIASSIEDSINYYEPMTFTKNDANIISQIRERIDLNTLDKNIFEIFEYIKEHDRYNEEEYQIYLGLKKMIFDGIDGLFIPQKYISFNSFDTIIFENRIIYILPIEEYKTLSTQINKINLLKKEVQENKNIKEKLPLHYKTEKSEHFTRNVEVNRAEADIEIATNSNTNGEDVSNPILYLDRNIVMEACMGEEDIYIICSTISFHTLYQLSQYLHRDGRNRKAFIVIDDNIKEKEHFFMYMNNRHEGYKSCELDYAIKAYAIHKALGNKDIIFYYKGKVEQGLITSNASIFGFKHFGTFKNQQVYFDNRGMATEYNKYFTIEQIDLSDEKYDHENNNYALHHRYSTKEIYYLMLLNIFQDDELKKTREDVEKSNLPESEIWNKLYEFQKDGVYALLHRIEKYNGAILADDVGLGKTYQALAVAKYYSSLGKKVLVIAPKKLYENWDRELAKKNTATFKKDGFDYTVIYHTTLTSKNLPSGGLVEEFNFDFFDLIIVDEAHAFRNKTSTRHKELANILGNTKKVLFLTATPVNNSLKDLDNLIKLCTGFNDKILENKKIYSIEKELKNAQKCVELDLEFNKNFYEIVDTFIVTRDKKYIKNNYVTTIDFPSKKVQEVSSYGIDSLIIDKLYKNILSLSLAAYSPSEFFPKNENFQYREVAIQSLIINLLFKRFESSYESFESTLKKIRNKFEGIVSSKLKYHCETLKLVSVDDRPIEIEFDNSDEIELDDYELLYNNTGKSTVHLKRTPLELKNIIRKDIEIIDEILGSIDYIVEGNKKFTMLSDEIRKIKEGEKIVIFTTYSDTAIEIYNFLINQFKNKGIGLVTGQKSKYVSKRGNEIDVNNRYEEILKSFSPKSKGIDILEEKQIDILVATDVISEGQNLQDCSNILHFDIHWNPVRMIQRIGRIDRIGSTHKEINNIIFWPTSSIDKYIELTKKINTKFQIIEATGGTTLEKEAQFNTEKEQIKSIIAGKDLNTTDFVEKLQNATNKFYPYIHDYKYLDNDINSFMGVKKSKEILMQLRGVFSVIKSDKCQITALISINNSKLLVLRISENGEIIEIEPTNLVNDIKKISEKSNQYTYLEKDEIKYYKNFFEIGILEIAKINKTSTENIQFICGLIEIQ